MLGRRTVNTLRRLYIFIDFYNLISDNRRMEVTTPIVIALIGLLITILDKGYVYGKPIYDNYKKNA